MNEGTAFDFDRQVTQIRECSGLASEEGGQMARNCGILRVGQSHLGETGPAHCGGRFGNCGAWEKAFDENFFQAFAGKLGFDRAADQCGTTTGYGNGELFCFGIGEEPFLGFAAGVGKR
jgi:hypothetical protein